MAKRIVASLLAMLILAAFLTACTDSTDDLSANSETISTESPMVETATETEVSDDLPDLDFNGTDFSILLRTDQMREFIAEAESSEVKIGRASWRERV